jgi:hypothetical protein
MANDCTVSKREDCILRTFCTIALFSVLSDAFEKKKCKQCNRAKNARMQSSFLENPSDNTVIVQNMHNFYRFVRKKCKIFERRK